jgi:hypothetical protein
MRTPTVTADVLSIYKVAGIRVILPDHLNKPTPDMRDAIVAIRDEVRARGRDLVLSDLFRTHDMQLQAALHYQAQLDAGVKDPPFSPMPVGSMHEAGRAFDLSLADLKLTTKKNDPNPFFLKDFWDIAAKFGVVPIINKPDDSSVNEAWHFDCPGSHQIVRDYYAAKKATGFVPYKAMAISGVLALGLPVDDFKDRQKEAAMQSGLIRLGFELGPIDGFIGVKTRGALEQAGITFTTVEETLQAVEDQLQLKFPGEYKVTPAAAAENIPAHLTV